MKKKPVGTTGSWFAKYEGENLPCVHDHWVIGKPMRYRDANVSSDPKWEPFIRSITDGQKVLLTNDHRDAEGKPTGKRKGYIAVWRVENVRVEETSLLFDFVEKLDGWAVGR